MFYRLLLAILVFLGITSLVHYYIFQRLIEPLVGEENRTTSLAIVGSLWLMTIVGFPIARAVPRKLRSLLEVIMFTWMGFAYLLMLVCVATLPFSALLNFFGRSEFVLAIFVLGVSSVLAWRAVGKVLRPEKIRYQVIPVNKTLPPNLEKLNCVVISDVHVAGLVGGERMVRLRQTVNSLKPDLIFVTGDLVDGSVRQLRQAVLPLAEMQATHGVYYVTGNHEFYSNPKQWREFCANELGWKVLSNDNFQLKIADQQINIIGIEDRSWLRQPNGLIRKDTRLDEAVQSISPDSRSQALNILLAHQPKDAASVERHQWIDVQVSGHTHGGQFWPLHYFVYRDQTYNTGLYTIKNTRTRLYVSEGTGFWGPPMRLGTNCEICILRFVSGSESGSQSN
ncbi:metallophosphoesterase [bacterium]|nr:metallophosphoesterase [bacterium]